MMDYTGRNIGELMHGDRGLHDFPKLFANDDGDFAALRQFEEWLIKRDRDAVVATQESEHGIAVITVANTINPNVLHALSFDVADQVDAVTTATPGGLLAELAMRQTKSSH